MNACMNGGGSVHPSKENKKLYHIAVINGVTGFVVTKTVQQMLAIKTDRSMYC